MWTFCISKSRAWGNYVIMAAGKHGGYLFTKRGVTDNGLPHKAYGLRNLTLGDPYSDAMQISIKEALSLLTGDGQIRLIGTLQLNHCELPVSKVADENNERIQILDKIKQSNATCPDSAIALTNVCDVNKSDLIYKLLSENLIKIISYDGNYFCFAAKQ